jgi:UDP-2,3-diacylglucosamine pyrophosphatase LpxH
MERSLDNGLDSGCNVVVVSDVHLGEDLLPGASGRSARDVTLAETALVDFVKHLSRSRVDGRPWRLVVNGDMLDLMVVPNPGGALPTVRTSDKACERIDAVVARHPEVFAALARFVAAGHRLDVIAGNHDLELVWPEVAAHLAAGIAARAPAGARGVADRIAVRPWFVYEPGLCWIEHGHQYDATCSQQFGLAPTDPRSGTIVDNIDYAAVRHLGGAAPEIDSSSTEAWGFGGYLRFAWSLGPAGFARMGRGYWRFVRSLWHARRLHRSVRVRRARAQTQAARIDQLAAQSHVSRELLGDVADLARSPVTTSTRRLAALLMVDRFLLCAAALVALLVSWALAPAGPAVLLTGAVGVGTWTGGSALARLRNPDNITPLRLAAERIVARVDAPFVVFGHTHEPVHDLLPRGGAYLNGGTWLPAIRPGLLRAFTHVVLRRTPAGPVAELRQWRDGASRRFGEAASSPTPVPAAAPEFDRPVAPAEAPAKPAAPAAAA